MLSISKSEKKMMGFNIDETEISTMDLSLESNYFVMIESLYPQLCQITKISDKGLTLRYFFDTNHMNDEGKLDLLKTGSGFANQEIRYQKTSDVVIDNSSNLELRECELKFTNPDNKQKNAIKSFVNNIDLSRITIN